MHKRGILLDRLPGVREKPPSTLLSWGLPTWLGVLPSGEWAPRSQAVSQGGAMPLQPQPWPSSGFGNVCLGWSRPPRQHSISHMLGLFLFSSKLKQSGKHKTFPASGGRNCLPCQCQSCQQPRPVTESGSGASPGEAPPITVHVCYHGYHTPSRCGCRAAVRSSVSCRCSSHLTHSLVLLARLLPASLLPP